MGASLTQEEKNQLVVLTTRAAAGDQKATEEIKKISVHHLYKPLPAGMRAKRLSHEHCDKFNYLYAEAASDYKTPEDLISALDGYLDKYETFADFAEAEKEHIYFGCGKAFAHAFAYRDKE